MKELGWKDEVKIEIDSNSAIGTLHRRGLGKLRHTEVEELWMQQAMYRKQLKAANIRGVENTADTGTKAVEKDTNEYHLWKMGFESVGGETDMQGQGQDETHSATHARAGAKGPGGPREGRRWRARATSAYWKGSRHRSTDKEAISDSWRNSFGSKEYLEGSEKWSYS